MMVALQYFCIVSLWPPNVSWLCLPYLLSMKDSQHCRHKYLPPTWVRQSGKQKIALFGIKISMLRFTKQGMHAVWIGTERYCFHLLLLKQLTQPPLPPSAVCPATVGFVCEGFGKQALCESLKSVYVCAYWRRMITASRPTCFSQIRSGWLQQAQNRAKEIGPCVQLWRRMARTLSFQQSRIYA